MGIDFLKVSLLGLVTLLIGNLLGCTSSPVKRTFAICAVCQSMTLNQTGPFPLRAYSQNFGLSDPALLIHVYFEGDGRPWLGRRPWRMGRVPNLDPNSRALTALRLMVLDPYPSIYLNRPCYGYSVMPANCEIDLWTMGRYSATIVSALDHALDELKAKFPSSRFLFFGHSGGGSLAMLLAQDRTDVAGVVTVAANIDHQTWTEHFRFSPLNNSLNAADLPPLPPTVLRWHFAGDRDDAVPADLTKAAVNQDPYARFTLISGFSHECCWEKDWLKIIEDVRAELVVQGLIN